MPTTAPPARGQYHARFPHARWAAGAARPDPDRRGGLRAGGFRTLTMLAFAVIAVFVSGLMIGRTPEYLGKKIEVREIWMAMLIILTAGVTVLVLSGAAMVVPTAVASIANPGAHGLSEVLYAFASMANNNGSAFRRPERQHPSTTSSAPWPCWRPLYPGGGRARHGRLAGREEIHPAQPRHPADRPRPLCHLAVAGHSHRRRPDLFPGSGPGADRRNLP